MTELREQVADMSSHERDGSDSAAMAREDRENAEAMEAYYHDMVKKPCPTVIREVERVPDKEAIALCLHFGMLLKACRNALRVLGQRPWTDESVQKICQAFVPGAGAAAGEDKDSEADSDPDSLKNAPMKETSLLELERRLSHGAAQGDAEASFMERRARGGGQASLLTLDRTMAPKAHMAKPGHKCRAKTVARMPQGPFSTLGACADYVQSEGGKYFAYGKHDSKGQCFESLTSSQECPEGFDSSNDFDFYSVSVSQARNTCERPKGWCLSTGATYEVRDCDFDNYPDPYCIGPQPGETMFMSSSRACEEVNNVGCEARRLKSKDSGQCVTDTGELKVSDCKTTAEGETEPGQNWYFAGNVAFNGAAFLKNDGGNECLAEDDNGQLSMKACRNSDGMSWFFDRQRLMNKLGRKCMSRNVDTSFLSMEECTSASNMMFKFSPARNCHWSDWSEGGGCSVSCGIGTEMRYRFVVQEAEPGGKSCGGSSSKTVSCSAPVDCPVDCKWSNWQEWQPCDKTCGEGGTQMRERYILEQAAKGGTQCVGMKNQKLACNEIPCPDDCMWGTWGRYQSCSRRCGGGLRTRSRVVARGAKSGGRPCPCCASEALPCNVHSCPIDCRWAAWPEWSKCPKTCGGSQTQRYRTIMNQARFGGRACRGDTMDTKACANIPCPVDCTWGMWNDWTDCPTSCGVNDGKITRDRGKIEEQFGGMPCIGPSYEIEVCNSRECPIDCIFGAWDEWSPCFKAVVEHKKGCYKQRRRSIKVDAEFGGHQCTGADYDTSNCKQCALSEETSAALLEDARAVVVEDRDVGSFINLADLHDFAAKQAEDHEPVPFRSRSGSRGGRLSMEPAGADEDESAQEKGTAASGRGASAGAVAAVVALALAVTDFRFA